MCTFPPTFRIFARPTSLARLAWALMLLVHIPALLSSAALIAAGDVTPAFLIRVGGLLLSMAFFALKVADVAALRFRSDRRSLLTLAIAITCVHAQPLGAGLAGLEVPVEVPVAAAVLLASQCAGAQALLAQLPRLTQRFRPLPGLTPHAVAYCTASPLPWFRATRRVIPRPPPRD